MQQNIKDLEILSQSFSPAQIFRYIYLLCMTFQFDKQCKVLQDMQSSQSGTQRFKSVMIYFQCHNTCKENVATFIGQM